MLPEGPPAPFVTVVMPIRNEEAFLARCLDSVAATDYPPDRFELLILDGRSTDRSVAIAEGYRDRIPGLRVLDNPDRIQAAAFNRAVEVARGDYVVRMDAHTLYAPDYVSRCVELLQSSGAANVGGPQRAVGETPLTRAIAFAVSSRFGAGDASYRHTETDVWSDTVYLGAWRLDTVRSLGGMRSDWAVNEDYEFNYRLRRSGGRVLVSPSIRSTYFVRGTLAKLARQYFRYGLWKVRTLMSHPASLRLRQTVAPAFSIYLVTLPITAWVLGWPAVTPLAAYLLALAVVTGLASRREGVTWWFLPLIYPVIHLSWGLGFRLGWLRWLPGRAADRRGPPPRPPAGHRSADTEPGRPAASAGAPPSPEPRRPSSTEARP